MKQEPASPYYMPRPAPARGTFAGSLWPDGTLFGWCGLTSELAK